MLHRPTTRSFFDVSPTLDGQPGSGSSWIKDGNKRVSDLQSGYEARLRSRSSAGEAEVSGSSHNSHNSREGTLANVAGGLPGPFESEKSSLLRQMHAQIAAEYSAASAPTPEATVVMLGTDASQGFPTMA